MSKRPGTLGHMLRVILETIRPRRCMHGCGYRCRSSAALSAHYNVEHAGDPVGGHGG